MDLTELGWHVVYHMTSVDIGPEEAREAGPVRHYRAGDVAEALELLAGFDGGAKLLAGGQSLVAMMNFRLARPPALIDITRIGGLNYLRAGRTGCASAP